MNKNIKNNRIIMVSAIFAIIFLCCSIFCNTGIAAFADTAAYTVTFYSDKNVDDAEDKIFTTITTVDGWFTVPENAPKKDKYTFSGWSDGFQHYHAGRSYKIASNLSLSATYTEVVTNKPYARMSPTTIALLVTGVVVMLAAILFFYYWCGVKNRSVKLIPKYIKKLFTKNKNK